MLSDFLLHVKQTLNLREGILESDVKGVRKINLKLLVNFYLDKRRF